MPVYKDNEHNSWYAIFRYTDAFGNRKQKMKRGFKLKKDAQKFENDFLQQNSKKTDITFQNFLEIYYQDMQPRLKANTLHIKRIIIDKHILPYFGAMLLEDIKPSTILAWQNEMLSRGLSPGYLKKVNTDLKAIFSHACKYYGLRENPCKVVGTVGSAKKDKEKIKFWTLEEYKKFIEAVKESNDINSYIAFATLYFTGVRIGELLALTLSDIDSEENKIYITKNLQVIEGQEVVTTPKTNKSDRVVTIPDSLKDDLQRYIDSLYKPRKNTRLFVLSRTQYRIRLKKYAAAAGVPVIRLHDLRHSHASLLIQLGFPAIVIADRLGHEKVSTTLDIYGHLFPEKHDEITEKLNLCYQTVITE